MFRRDYNQRALSRILCGLVLFALLHSATAWASCPHLSASAQSCLNEHHVEMVMAETHDGACSHSIVSDAIAPLPESCSYCAMHSRSDLNEPATRFALNSPASQGIVPVGLAVIVPAPPSPSFDLVYLNDHGPPGLNSSRHILNSSLRI